VGALLAAAFLGLRRGDRGFGDRWYMDDGRWREVPPSCEYEKPPWWQDKSLPHVAEGGQAATIVNFDGDFEEAIDRNITVHGVLVRAGYQVLDRLSGAVRDGLRPTLSGTWPLAEALTAHKRLVEGRVGGKLVLMVSGQVRA
jgi:hypothetical protein